MTNDTVQPMAHKWVVTGTVLTGKKNDGVANPLAESDRPE